MDEPGTDPTEAALVRRAQAGEELAIRELFERHVGDLRRRVRRRLPALIRGKVDASDVVQEAYLTAFVRLADFEDQGEGSFGRWVGKILEHKLRDEIRRFLATDKRSARKETSLEATGGAPMAACLQRTPGSAAAAAEDRARVLASMKFLSSEDQEILRLVHEGGLKFTEAGERLGLSPDAARMRHARALSRIARRLTGEAE